MELDAWDPMLKEMSDQMPPEDIMVQHEAADAAWRKRLEKKYPSTLPPTDPMWAIRIRLPIRWRSTIMRVTQSRDLANPGQLLIMALAEWLARHEGLDVSELVRTPADPEDWSKGVFSRGS